MISAFRLPILAATLGVTAATSFAAPPNIIVIMADDQGYGDMGCQGHPTLRTPEMDRLAADGVQLTSFYAGASVCSPSRAALLTGQYPIRHGITNALTHEELKGLAPGTPTLPRQLQAAGYETALIGKWHLGKGADALPNAQGFDEFFGFLSTNNSYPTPDEIAPGRLAEDITWNDGASLASLQEDAREKTFVRVPYVRNGKVVEYPADNARHTERLTAEAVDFIRRPRDGRPFFLFLAHAMPHYPIAVSDEARGQSKHRVGPDGIYGDVIERLDWSLGEVRRALAATGQDRNTIIVYTSDNGAAPGGRYFTGASNAPLSGGKGGSAEGAHRVPCLIAAPGLIPGGRVSDQLVAMMDLYPTLLAAAGVSVPAGHTPDGTDHWPFLRDSGDFTPRERYGYFVGPRLAALREGDWKWEARSDGAPRLFDLTTDPAEKRDQSAAKPAVAAQLSESFQAFQAKLLPP